MFPQLSDQPAVLSDISVTPQRIMTVGAAVLCVVLKRFISSCVLSSASAQVLNNTFFSLRITEVSRRKQAHECNTGGAVASLAVFFMTQADVCINKLHWLFAFYMVLSRHQASKGLPSKNNRQHYKKKHKFFEFFFYIYLLLDNCCICLEKRYCRKKTLSTKMLIIMDIIHFSSPMLPRIFSIQLANS